VYLRVLRSVEFLLCTSDGRRVLIGATPLVSGPSSDVDFDAKLYGDWAARLPPRSSIRERQFLLCADDALVARGVAEAERTAAGYRDQQLNALRRRGNAPVVLAIHTLTGRLP
jgi:hypothetical protein